MGAYLKVLVAALTLQTRRAMRRIPPLLPCDPWR